MQEKALGMDELFMAVHVIDMRQQQIREGEKYFQGP